MNTTQSLNDAVRDERTVRFTYKGEPRTVDLNLISAGRVKGEQFVTGFDHDRDDLRRFSVSKIENLTVL